MISGTWRPNPMAFLKKVESDYFFQATRNPDSRASMMTVEDALSFSNSSGV
jgi:hypothetical protein